jgi:SnoaL-like domain
VAALALVRGPVPAVARTPDLRVEVSSEGLVGWFSTHVELLPTDQPLQNAVQMRASGVFRRDRGEWRLLQIQLSRPHETPPPEPADSATPPAPGASRTSDEAPGEGG